MGHSIADDFSFFILLGLTSSSSSRSDMYIAFLAFCLSINKDSKQM